MHARTTLTNERIPYEPVGTVTFVSFHAIPGSLSRLQLHIREIGVGGPFRDTPRQRQRHLRAIHYAKGLLLPGERKSMEPMAHRVEGAQYEANQHFITNAPWDWEATQSSLIDVMKREATGPHGLLVFDDVPLAKQGKKSPGVQRQYSGVRGGVDNCQALVDTVYVLPNDKLHRESLGWCIAIELYLPKVWAEDPARCEEAGIPLPVVFREKWRIALEEVKRAREHELPHEATLGDCGYGDVGDLRTQLRDWHEPYVMEVTASEVRVVPESIALREVGSRAEGKDGENVGRFTERPLLPEGVKARSAREVTGEVRGWTTVRWGEGTKGPLEGRFARCRVRVCHGQIPTKETGWLLLETAEEGPRSWICWGLDKKRLEELAAIAHRRFLIERFHEEAKMELGMDHFEGRRWRGLNHHLTMVLIAHTFLVREQLRARREEMSKRKKEGGEEAKAEAGLLPTLAEMRRRVVREVALALASRIALDPTKEERMKWANALADYWTWAG